MISSREIKKWLSVTVIVFGIILMATRPIIVAAQTSLDNFDSEDSGTSGNASDTGGGDSSSSSSSADTGAAATTAGGVASCLGTAAVAGGVTAGTGAATAVVSVPVSNVNLSVNLPAIQTVTGGVFTKQCILDAIAKGIAQDILNRLTNSVISWINSGFKGSPTFIQNPSAYFKNLADTEFGNFIDGAGLSFACQQFRPQLQLAFLQQRDYFTEKVPTCTLSNIVSNWQGFANGDFNQGGNGWNSWITMVSVQQNNPFGAYQLAQEQLGANVTIRKGTAQNQLNWGQGFLSLKDASGNVTTPGNLVAQAANKTFGNTFDQLNLTKNFDDIIVALVNTSINMLMTKGLSKI